MPPSGVLVLVVVIGFSLVLRSAFLRGMRSRTVDTALPPDAVHALFAGTVASYTWKIDPADPMVARSSLLMGLQRQRIGLTVAAASDGRTRATVEVLTYVGQWVSFPSEPTR